MNKKVLKNILCVVLGISIISLISSFISLFLTYSCVGDATVFANLCTSICLDKNKYTTSIVVACLLFIIVIVGIVVSLLKNRKLSSILLGAFLAVSIILVIISIKDLSSMKSDFLSDSSYKDYTLYKQSNYVSWQDLVSIMSNIMLSSFIVLASILGVNLLSKEKMSEVEG